LSGINRRNDPGGKFGRSSGRDTSRVIREISFPAKLLPELSLGLNATSTFVNGSNATERKPSSGAPGGFGVHVVQLPAVNVSVVRPLVQGADEPNLRRTGVVVGKPERMRNRVDRRARYRGGSAEGKNGVPYWTVPNPAPLLLVLVLLSMSSASRFCE